MTVINVDTNNFKEEVLKADKPVVVDFWAEWCGPCKTISPFLDEISVELADLTKIVKVNIDVNPELATEFGVCSIPTLMVFRAGKVADVKTGALPKTALSQWIKKVIS